MSIWEDIPALDKILNEANKNGDRSPLKFKISEPYSESKNPYFVELAKTLPPPKERKTYTKEEIIAMQPKSTQRMMLMTDAEHAAFHASPISTEGQTTLADISLSDEELAAKTATRSLTAEEVVLYEAHRRASKNTQNQFDKGHGNTKATGDSSVTPETKEKAADAFCFSPGIYSQDVDRCSIVGLKTIKSEAPPLIDPNKKRSGWGWWKTPTMEEQMANKKGFWSRLFG